MKRTLSRRDFIKLSAVGGGMAIFGFNPQSRSWITQAQAQTQSFSDIPNLDGVLLFDETTRKALSDDWGHLVHKIPAAVLRPKSVQDIVKIVQYANQHSIKIAVKGQAHCQYGQSQAEAGIVIDSGVLNAVQAPTADSVDVQPGVILGQLAGAALSKSLTPPVLPECMMLTVGGTLSAGGLGNTSQHHGALVDNDLRESADTMITKASLGAIGRYESAMRRDPHGYALRYRAQRIVFDCLSENVERMTSSETKIKTVGEIERKIADTGVAVCSDWLENQFGSEKGELKPQKPMPMRVIWSAAGPKDDPSMYGRVTF